MSIQAEDQSEQDDTVFHVLEPSNIAAKISFFFKNDVHCFKKMLIFAPLTIQKRYNYGNNK
jgi:hypothetical protein